MNQCRKSDFSDNWGNDKEGGKKKKEEKKNPVEVAGENEITKRGLEKTTLGGLFLLNS